MAKSRIKVPKKVVGVKIPKSVRKGPVMDFVNSTAGRVLIAQALTAAIGAFAYKHADPETRDQIRGKVKKGTDGAREMMSRNTTRLSYAFGEAVTAFRAALEEPVPPEFSEAESSTEPRDTKKNKKQNWSSSEPVGPH
jgi:hypothetical protein